MKAIGGFGTTIDVCLVNGRLKFGQTIVLPGTDGPIVTTIKVIITMTQLRFERHPCVHKLFLICGVSGIIADNPIGFCQPKLLPNLMLLCLVKIFSPHICLY